MNTCLRFSVALILLPVMFCATLYAEWPRTPLPVEITTSPEDTEYLRGILKDTFRSIMYFRNPKSGLCSDYPENPVPGEIQKAEHQFLMLTSIAIAGKIGLLTDAEAAKEVDKTLSTMGKMERNRGFFMGAYNCATGEVDKNYPIYSVADCGWIYCGLATVAEAYPQFRKRVDKILNGVDFPILYKEGMGMYGCIQFKADGSAKGMWKLREVMGDGRTFAFFMTGSGGMPPSVWNAMEEAYVERYGVKYFKPGEAMGYGEQPMSMGYFLDERGSKYGLSCANLGWGQINYAADMEFPTWGWSSCLDIDGYLGWGNHKSRSWSRINTHAVAAQVIYYPNQVAKAFRTMEKLGLRKPVTTHAGKIIDFGFRDSIDVDTLTSPSMLLCGLDQNIVFLSLANYLHDGVVWRYFMRSPQARHALEVIRDYRNPRMENLALYKKRDLAGPKLPSKKSPRPPKLIVDDFSGEINSLGGARREKASSSIIEDNTWRITFNHPSEQMSNVYNDLNGVDLTDYNSLKVVLKSDKKGRVMVNMHLGGEGGYYPVNVGADWTEIIIPFRSFLMGKEDIQFGNPDLPMRWTAMWHNRADGQDVGFGPISAQTLDVKEISFLSLPKEEIRECALKLLSAASVTLAADGTLDDMEDPGAWWPALGGEEVRLFSSVEKGIKGNCICFTFSIPAKGGWIVLSKEAGLAISPETEIVFNCKGQGGPANLEIKIIDSSGANFVHVLENEIQDSGWNEISIKCSELRYGWGGEKKDFPDKASKIEFAIASGGAASGKLWLDELKLIQPKDR